MDFKLSKLIREDVEKLTKLLLEITKNFIFMR
jgi:hypothetical protein